MELIGLFLLLLVVGIVSFRIIAGVARREKLREEEHQTAALVKTCPQCAEEVNAAAKICIHCGHRFAD